jgi:hypothetical protein
MKTLFTCLCLLIPTSAFANWFDTDSIGQSQPLLKGEFQQQKKTKHLRRPIKSSGTVVLSNKHGVIWQTVKPVKSTMVITSSQIKTIDSQDRQKVIAPGSDLNTLFSNALSGNWTLLKAHFDLSTSPSPHKEQKQQQDNMCVTLLPTSTTVKKTFQQMKVCGDKTKITSLNIVEANGGTTNIEITLAPAKALTKAEQALFND